MQDELSPVERLWDSVREHAPRHWPKTGEENSFNWDTTDWDRRRFFTSEYSWAIPTPKTIGQIKSFLNQEPNDPADYLLDVGAGSGLWARLLHEAGCRVVATDAGKQKWPKSFAIVQKLSALQAVRVYSNAPALMLCWPPYADPMAHTAITRFMGDKLIYIGEGAWGCTGNERFHKHLEKHWKLIHPHSICQWPGMNDWLGCYVRA